MAEKTEEKIEEQTEEQAEEKIEEKQEQPIEENAQKSDISGSKESIDSFDIINSKQEEESKKEINISKSEKDTDNLKQDKNGESLEEEKISPPDLDDTNEKVKENIKKDEEKDNIIFVGIKPFMNYVTGVIMQFQNKGQDEVIVSARGKFISKAVDVAEVSRRTFLKDENIRVDNINITSEQFENKEGRRIFVSAIEIKLIRG